MPEEKTYRPQVSGVDRIYLLLAILKHEQEVGPFFPNNLDMGVTWLFDTVKPYVNAKLGAHTVEEDGDDAAILRSLAALNYKLRRLSRNEMSYGYGESDPFLTALGKYNNIEKYLFGKEGRTRIGYLDIPGIYNSEHNLNKRAQSFVFNSLKMKGYLRPIPKYERSDKPVPWTVTMKGDEYQIELDPEYEPHEVIAAILEKNFVLPDSGEEEEEEQEDAEKDNEEGNEQDKKPPSEQAIEVRKRVEAAKARAAAAKAATGGKDNA